MSPRLLALTVAFFAALALLAVPLGRHLARTFEAPLRPWERRVLTLAGVDPDRPHTWRDYALAALAFTLVTHVTTYALLRLQGALPGHATGLRAVPAWLAFNTATSFATNTDWQSYAGESTAGDLAQTVALTSQNFFSAAVGLCVAIALLRGLSRRETDALGNFWLDLVRAHLFVLVPGSAVLAVFLASRGVVQTLDGPAVWRTLDGAVQSVPRGLVASQEAIKMLGTNGGGFYNANSAHPWENPDALTNLAEMLAIFALPAALCVTLGEYVKNRRHGAAVFAAMTLLALAGVCALGHFEHQGNPLLAALGVDVTAGNLEGKELRFGVDASSLFATVTTDASCGAVNAMHDSFMPLGGLVPMLNIQLGEVVFGGVGSGLYGALVYVVLAVFLAGLMVGRTPEYLGRKIDRRDVRLAALYVLVPAFTILVGAAVAVVTDAGRAGVLNTGAATVNAPWGAHPHGLSEVLYAYSSAAGNNGSAFAGLTAFSAARPVFYSLTLGVAMFVGRLPLMVLALALAGSMARKKQTPPGIGSLPVEGPLFVALLVGVIVVVGALTFFPALSLGPIVEHLQLTAAGGAR